MADGIVNDGTGRDRPQNGDRSGLFTLDEKLMVLGRRVRDRSIECLCHYELACHDVRAMSIGSFVIVCPLEVALEVSQLLFIPCHVRHIFSGYF